MNNWRPSALLIPVREFVNPSDGDELRFTLRGIERNAPWITQVIIAGHLPEWCHNVTHVPTEQFPGRKWSNATDNILAACGHPDVPESFAWGNDDMWLTRPIDSMPPLHRGPVTKVYTHYRRTLRGNGPYMRGMHKTMRTLEAMGYREPLSYELHSPLVVERDLLADCIATLKATAEGDEAMHTRTFFANVASLGGERVEDCKMIRAGDEYPPGPWWSTTDNLFDQHMGKVLRWLLPEPSRWELHA